VKYNNYLIHNFALLKIDQSLRNIKEIEKSIRYFKIENSSIKKKLYVLNINKLKEIKYTHIYGSKQKEFYMKDNEYFYYGYRGNVIRIKNFKNLKEIDEIQVSENFNVNILFEFIEFLIRINVVEINLMLIHSAAVSYKEAGILFLGWPGCGKTSLTLDLIENGFDFLSEDKVWVSLDKTIYNYPRYIRLNKSNINIFKDKLNFIEKIKLNFSNILSKLLSYSKLTNKSLLANAANRGVFLPKIKIDPLKDDKINIRSKVGLKYTYFINQRNDLSKKDNNQKEDLARIIKKISDFEWNNKMKQIISMHNFLFPNHKWEKEFDNFLKKETEIIESLFGDSKYFILNTPVVQKRKSKQEIIDLKNKLGEAHD